MYTIHEIIEAKWLEDYKIRVIFSDLKKAVIDLRKYLGHGIFKELVSIEKFKRFRVDAELGTVVWPNGADIAPEVLYQEAFHVQKVLKLKTRALASVREPATKYGKKK